VKYIITNLDSKDYKSGKDKGTQKKSWRPKYITETVVPVASFILKEKGAPAKQMGPVPTDVDLVNFRENVTGRKAELTIAKLTYLAAEGEHLGQWVTEDLLENKVELINK
jgi:hypothetical protein